MIRKRVVAVILALGVFLLVVVASVIGQRSEPVTETLPAGTCSDCHICFTPNKKDPCLRSCPRLSRTAIAHSPEEGPEVVILNQLEDLFEPVIFAHKLHAQMTQMGGGCEVCHHYSPKGHIPPCRQCHGGFLNPVDLRQPGLKGAYHRQCLNCHKEWSHSTECAVCHLKKAPGDPAIGHVDSTDIIGIYHPHISMPDRWIYQTSYEQGSAVIFHHKEHVDLFGIKCVSCHREESCSRCHEMGGKQERLARTPEEHHKPCISCHAMKRCQICHTAGGAEYFDHARTGWPLNRYHQGLRCRKCHPSGEKTSKPDRDCIACHGKWSTETFKHSVTGLTLDEIHQQMDCGNCHLESKFGKKPSCANCHDDGRTYPQSRPGTTM